MRYDVLVIGGGPAGATAAYWLASRGRSVLVCEKKRYPREKTCGDGLTPRSVRQLYDMGLASECSEFQRYDTLRLVAHGRTLDLRWPEHPVLPDHGYVIRRRDLDQIVARRAQQAGATLWEGAEVIEPLIDGGFLAGAAVRHEGTIERVEARFVVLADGANSRIGRALGTVRDRGFPLGLAIRGYYTSPLDGLPLIESHLDLVDKHGAHLPGYGWIFPVGDGTVNVGVGLLSTFSGWKDINTTNLLQAFVEAAPPEWGIAPDTAVGAATGGRLPTGGSINPKVGPNWLVAGDAAGSINPFNGEGIAYAYETGRLAADAVELALSSGDGLALQTYNEQIEDIYRLYFRVARAFVNIIGNPAVMRECTRVAIHSRTLMEWLLRIMANLLRPDELGPAEAAYALVERIVALAPEP